MQFPRRSHPASEWPSFLQLFEFGRHRRVAPGQLLDGHVLRLVIGEAKIPVGAEQRILRLLQMVDRFVDFVDRALEAPGCEIVILREGVLERLEIGFEVGDVDALRLDERKLRLVFQRVHRGIPEQRDDGNEKLRPHDVHFRITMENVDDSGVVEFALWFQQGYQNGIFAALLGAIPVELLQEILVPAFRRGIVALVLHFEHDRDDLGAGLVRIAEDVVALAAAARVVVLLEIRPGKGGGPDAVEFGFAVLLQRFADHLGRQARLHVPQALDGFIAVPELRLVFFPERLLGELLLQLRMLETAFEFVALLLDRTDGLGDRELLPGFHGVQLRIQPQDLGIPGGGGLLQFAGERRFRKP